jgi:hypothetical protein
MPDDMADLSFILVLILWAIAIAAHAAPARFP